MLALLPDSNGVAQMLRDAEAGVVVNPADRTAAVTALNRLISDPSARARLGAAARRYSEETFGNVLSVGNKVEALLQDLVKERGRSV